MHRGSVTRCLQTLRNRGKIECHPVERRMSRRHDGHNSGPHSTVYNLRGPCFMKVLLPDKVTGSVIGRGGAVLADFEQQSGAQIKVSPPKVFFPSTRERMVMGSGELQSITALLPLFLLKMKEHGADPGQMSIKLTIPNSSIPSVIGKGGEIIRGIEARCGAHVHMGERLEGLPETIVEVKGGEFEIQNACGEILHIIQRDPGWREVAGQYYGNFSAPSGPPGGEYPPSTHMSNHGPPPPHMMSHMGPPPLPRQSDPTTNPQLLSYPLTIEFVVPPMSVPFILGEKGATADFIFSQTGASVVVQDLAPGATDANVAISGPLCGVQAAHLLVIKHVTDALMQQHVR